MTKHGAGAATAADETTVAHISHRGALGGLDGVGSLL